MGRTDKISNEVVLLRANTSRQLMQTIINRSPGNFDLLGTL